LVWEITLEECLNDVVALERWGGPAPMDTGAPEPVAERVGDELWVAYLAHDPEYPVHDAPAAAEYLERHPGEFFGVLRFVGVVSFEFGLPNDERLCAHPLYQQGLELYAFHRGELASGAGCWVVTFHDESLIVQARSAEFFEASFAEDRLAAIRCCGGSV